MAGVSTRSNAQSEVMSDNISMENGDSTNTNIVKSSNINTILYIAQYIHVSEEGTKFSRTLEEYDFSKDEFSAAETKFRADLIARSVTNVTTKTAKKTKRGNCQELYKLLGLANLEANPEFKYYPDLKDTRTIVDGSRASRKLNLVEDNVLALEDVVKDLEESITKKLEDTILKKIEETIGNITKPIVTKPIVVEPVVTPQNVTASSTTNTFLNVPTVDNSVALVPNRPTYANVISRFPGHFLQPPRKRSTSEAISFKSAKSKLPKPKVSNTGTGGPIKDSWQTAGPKKKVACKVSFMSDGGIADLETFCKASNTFKNLYDKLAFEDMGESRTGFNCRVTCTSWTINPKDLFSDPKHWPSGAVVSPWRGPIRPITPRKTVRKFLGNINATTTLEAMKKEVLRLYALQEIKNVQVMVEEFKGKKDRKDVANFVVEISSTDNSTPKDILESAIHHNVFVRHWSGPLPSKRNAASSRQTFTV